MPLSLSPFCRQETKAQQRRVGPRHVRWESADLYDPGGLARSSMDTRAVSEGKHRRCGDTPATSGHRPGQEGSNLSVWQCDWAESLCVPTSGCRESPCSVSSYGNVRLSCCWREKSDCSKGTTCLCSPCVGMETARWFSLVWGLLTVLSFHLSDLCDWGVITMYFMSNWNNELFQLRGNSCGLRKHADGPPTKGEGVPCR